MESSRVTQQDIADKAGVHRGTVSLALKHSPRIPAETRERILKLAEEMGYVPDPMLSSLAAYRNRRREMSYHGTLAWLTNSRNGVNWRLSPHYLAYYEGALERARSYGYKLEVFDINTEGMTPARLEKIFEARNISGILLCPRHDTTSITTEMELSWKNYSGVTFGYSFTKLGLHTVAEAHFRSLRRVTRELRTRGYRRIGLVVNRDIDFRMDDSFIAGFLSDFYWDNGPPSVPPLGRSFDWAPNRFDAAAFNSWRTAHGVDAIVTNYYGALETLTALGLRVPDDLGVICPNLPAANAALTGMVSDVHTVGGAALDLLVAMVQRGERGIPSHRLNIHVEGLWNEGASIRPKPGATTV